MRPWNRAQTSLNTSSENNLITPSGKEISESKQALEQNALQKAGDSSVHKSPTTTNTNSTAQNGTTRTGLNNRSGYGSYNRYGSMYGGGMYGGGMYGGGMYSPYGGMYGGMYGSQNSYSQYIFSICQAAQMIE